MRGGRGLGAIPVPALKGRELGNGGVDVRGQNERAHTKARFTV